MSIKTIILIGPLPNNRPESIGGTTKMFDLLIRFFRKNNLSHQVILSNKYGLSILNILNIIFNLLRHRRTTLVMFNLSSNVFLLKTLPILLITKLLNQKLVLRIFGGGIKERVESMNPVTIWILRTTVFKHSELILPETQRLIKYFEPDITNMDIFPNIREKNIKEFKASTFKKKFLFLSQVKEEKGIDLILDIKSKLDESYTIDIYGPILDSKYDYFKTEEFYKGSIPIDQVLEVISKYDIILLPTHWPGEGYPGIIIEGYSLGKPVITTKWLAIPEIVDQGVSGILIDPKSTDQLLDAIQNIKDTNYQNLSSGAFKKFEMFNADIVHERIYSLMQSL